MNAVEVFKGVEERSAVATVCTCDGCGDAVVFLIVEDDWTRGGLSGHFVVLWFEGFTGLYCM